MAYLHSVPVSSLKPLTRKQQEWAEAVVKGTAKPNRRWQTNPVVQQAIQDMQAKARAVVSYSLAQALRDCDTAAAFATEHKNPNALVKAYELKSKLSGLLIERVEVRTVSLKEALEAAKMRASARVVEGRLYDRDRRGGDSVADGVGACVDSVQRGIGHVSGVDESGAGTGDGGVVEPVEADREGGRAGDGGSGDIHHDGTDTGCVSGGADVEPRDALAVADDERAV